MNQPSVIVVPADNHIALSVIRSLGRRGFSVIAIARGRGFAHTSRYCTRVIPTASESLVYTTFQAARELPGSFIICLGELEILSLNQRREELAKLATLLFPDSKRFDLALNKEKTLEIAEEVGIPVPRTVDLVEDPQLLHCRELRFPVVIKPKSQDLLPFKVKYADTTEELFRELDGLKEHSDSLLIQERIQGYGVGIELLVKEGKTLLAFQHRRVREDPPSGGVSVCCVSEPIDHQLLEYSERLLAAMNWEGVAMVEYKVDPASGCPALMEVNGRFWGSLPLAIHAGADFPAALVSAQLPGAGVRPVVCRTRVRCRRLIGETKWLVTVLRQRTVPAWRALADYLWDFRPGVRYYVWSWDDPWPALYALLKRMGRSFRR